MVEDGENIDLVYTWVDGGWPGYLEERRRYSETPIDMNPERYRDAYQTLRYSLRSVAAYLPWIDRIFIVSNRPQVPAWLNLNNPRIRIVHTDEFMPDDCLPSFNSNAIESFLHRIPDLSEHFIYLCDDFLFANRTYLSDFWRDRRYTVFNTLFGENMKWRVYVHKWNIIGYGYFEHGPHFAKREYWHAMTRLLPEATERTRHNRFRHGDDLVTYKLYRRYMLSERRYESRPIPLWQLKKISVFHKIVNNARATRNGFDRIRRLRPKFISLNDDQRDDPNPEVIAMTRAFLDELYPDKCAFEK